MIDDNQRDKIIEKVFASNCQEKECVVCTAKQNFKNCRKSNVVYNMHFEVQKHNGTESTYWGE